MNEFLMDWWTFLTSQFGLVFLGIIIGHWFGAKLKREIGALVDKIDGKPND